MTVSEDLPSSNKRHVRIAYSPIDNYVQMRPNHHNKKYVICFLSQRLAFFVTRNYDMQMIGSIFRARKKPKSQFL